MPWDDNLDPETPAYAIASAGSNRVRVVAGPGTGKSFAMKRRVARLLELGADPATILPVTFTRVAAEDLHRELVGMGVEGCQLLEGTTLHSLALRVLVRNHVLQATGRVPRPLNEFEMKPLECDLAAAHGGVREVRKRIKAYEAAWARLQRDEPGFVQSAEDAAFERDLVQWLIFHRAMLIGEVIPHLYAYLRDNPHAEERTEFRHILVDEYQDLNRAEQGVISLLSDAAEVCIVGDDDQSIYSFKHAHPDGIREWLEGGRGADLTLQECRRCPTQVVAMANSLIRNNVNRPVPRELTPFTANGEGAARIIQYQTLDQEIAGVSRLIVDLVNDGVPPGDILVLAQRSVIGSPIYETLTASGMPAKSYYAEAELDDAFAQERFATLKLYVDPEDRVALRWLLGLNHSNWFTRAYCRLRDFNERGGVSPWETLEDMAEGRVSLPYTAGLVARYRELSAQIEHLAELDVEAGLLAVIDHLLPEGEARVRDLRALAVQLLTDDPNVTSRAFMRELVAAITRPEIPSEINEVRIMSLHKSKGLSAPVTVIAGCVEGLLPQQPSDDLPAAEILAMIEEQRRLFFVGITRVKASPPENKPGTLLLTCSRQMSHAAARRAGIVPAQFAWGDAHMHTSRFIGELGVAAPRIEAG